MDPLAHRILAAIQQHGTFTPAERDAFIAALEASTVKPIRGWQKWPDAQTFLVDLCEWAGGLLDADIPPRQKQAAAFFGCSERTILRWLVRAGLETWEDFQRFYTLGRRAEVDLGEVT